MYACSQDEVRIDTRIPVIHSPSELAQVVGDTPFTGPGEDQIIRAISTMQYQRPNWKCQVELDLVSPPRAHVDS